MKYQILDRKDYRDMPWKNGLGVTCEILREPADDSQPFDFRLSVADIKENGPFSIFSGYTRVINTLEGAGMRLTVDGQKSGDLKQYDPFVFSGDSQVESELIGSPIKDFNLIFNASAYQARLEWLNISCDPKVFASQAGQTIIYAVQPVNIMCPAFSVQLNAGQTLRIHNDKAGLTRFSLSADTAMGDVFCCLIELSARK